MTQPQRPDQEINPPATVIAPGGSAGVFKGRLVVIVGGSTSGAAGLFMYNPALAANDLVESGSPVNGTDTKGNKYLAGWTSYALVASTTYRAAALQSGGIFWYRSTTGEAGPYSATTALGVGGSTDQYLTATNTFVGQGTPAVAAPDPGISSPLTAESWHNLGFSNGWAGTFRYRMLPDGRVEVDVAISSAAATSSTVGTMPANYIPANTVYIAAGANGNVGTAVAPFIQFIGSTGVVTMNGLHAFSTAGTFVVGGSYPLT